MLETAANPHTAFAKSAFSLSGSSGLYDRARPSYPLPALAYILHQFPTDQAANVVELGPGTGLFTRMLLREGKGRVGSFVGVEPAEGMRIGFENAMKSEMEQAAGKVQVVEGTFESIPVESGGVDVVVAAQVGPFFPSHSRFLSYQMGGRDPRN
jgi:predicted methyltransferase